MSRRDRKPKARNPNAPTGYPTPADREHTARVEAIAAQRLAEAREADRKAREREAERLASMTPEQIAREKLAKEGAFRRMATLAGLMGGLAK
jgi:hypothetical protein